MKTLRIFFAIATTLVFTTAFANSALRKACKEELKDCKGKTDKAAHECLEKKEQHGVPNDGFSPACYEAHKAYEKKLGHNDEDKEKK